MGLPNKQYGLMLFFYVFLLYLFVFSSGVHCQDIDLNLNSNWVNTAFTDSRKSGMNQCNEWLYLSPPIHSWSLSHDSLRKEAGLIPVLKMPALRFHCLRHSHVVWLSQCLLVSSNRVFK